EAADVARLVSQSATVSDQQFDLGVLLAREAYRLHRSTATEGQLEAALVAASSAGRVVERTLRFDQAAGVFPNGRDDRQLVAVAGSGGVVRIFDVRTGRLVRRLRSGGTGFQVTTFSTDGTKLAVGSADGHVTLWEVATGRPIGVPLDVGGGTVYGIFDPT